MFVFDFIGWVIGWNLLFGAGGAYAGYKVGRGTKRVYG